MDWNPLGRGRESNNDRRGFEGGGQIKKISKCPFIIVSEENSHIRKSN